MKRKWNKLISGAICVSLVLPGSIVYAGEPGSVQDYGTGLEQQSEGKDDTGVLDLAAENMDDVEVFDAAQESVEPEAAEDAADGVAETAADDSVPFSASDNEEDVFADGDPETNFSDADEEPVLAAGESVPIDEAHFPDDNFRAYLLELESDIGDEDGVLDTEEIGSITEINSYYISDAEDNSGLDDYTGIEYLTALEVIGASATESAVTFSLDISKNTKLRELTISVPYKYDYETKKNEYLDDQNIIFGYGLASLEKLNMQGVTMESFDVSAFPGISEIQIARSSIGQMHISGSNSLTRCELQGVDNLDSIEFSALPALEEIGIDEMPGLTGISLSEVPCLNNLHMNYTGLERLSLSSCPKLKYLTLRENRLKTLDLRSCPNLEIVDVSFNELTELDITGLSKLDNIVCLLNNLKEIKGNTDKVVGYPAGQREAAVNLYGNVLYISQLWGEEKLWMARISNYRGLTPEGEDSGYGVDASMCNYFTVAPFEGNSTDVSFDLNMVSMTIPVKLHLTKAQNTKISVPQKVIASNAGDKGIEIYWEHVAGADGYYVYRKINDSAYKKIATVKGGHINSYTDKVSAWGKYSYKIKAYGKVNGKTAASKYSKVNSCMKDYSWKPKLTAKGGSKSAALTWKKLNGATGYQIYRAASKKGKYTKVATIKKGTTVKYTDSKLQAKKTYYYKIRPYLTVSKKNTYGSFSGIVTVKTK